MTSANDSLGLVGTTIAGKYAIESVVGRGGFATVYRATHVLWKRPVAIKVFTVLGQVAEAQRQKLLDDFIQEGALLADLSERSTAICQARDIGMLVTAESESVPYMVLEWLEGRSLEAILESERAANAAPRSLEEALRLLEPAAEALALAHSKGIAHRDVKPANIFVLGDADGTSGVKLLDFGIAKVVQDVQKMGFAKTAGHITSFTPLYGAPEQFNRSYGSTGPWTDVFALALVVGEVASGKEPMSGDSLMQLAFAAADVNRRPTPRTLGIETSDEVEAIFAKALAVRPDDRWRTAGAFWNALRTAVTGARPSSMGPGRTSTGPARTAPFSTSDTVMATGQEGSSLAPPAGAPPPPARGYGGPAPLSSRPSLPGAPFSGTGPAPGPMPRVSASASSAPSPTKTRGIALGAAAGAVLLVAIGVFALRASREPGASTTSSVNADAATASGPTASGSLGAIASASAGADAGLAAGGAASAACPAGMIRIPGGEFFMGSDEKDALDFEKPAHKVKLSAYCLDEFEQTVAQYMECSDRGGCRRAGRENVWPGIKDAQRKIYDPLCNIRNAADKANHPINCVDWNQAREACEARGSRLPTEAEWEFAARGPDGRIYPWGDEAPSAQLLNGCGRECVAWQKKHPDPDNPLASFMYDEDDGFPNTAPVGSFPKGKSRYGVQDVVGNVWEWVSDFYADYDPKGGSGGMVVDPKGPAAGADHVIRGGSWNATQPSWVRPSFRFHVAASARSYGFGFRCAKSL